MSLCLCFIIFCVLSRLLMRFSLRLFPQVMKGFPECLQADICLHLNANLLCTMKVFQSASMGCLRAFALRLTTTHLPPGDYIVYQGDEVNHLFFIMRGTVEILRDDVIMAILGEQNLVNGHCMLHLVSL